MAIVVLAGILAVKMRKVPVNINFFFVREYISKAKMLGMGNDRYCGWRTVDRLSYYIAGCPLWIHYTADIFSICHDAHT